MAGLNIVGFTSYMNFIKATASLSVGVGAILFALHNYAFDGRYAPASLADAVQVNAALANEVKEDVRVLTVTVGSVQKKLLEDQLLTLKIRACEAATPSSKQFFASQIQTAKSEYQEVTGIPYQGPSCQDLGYNQ